MAIQTMNIVKGATNKPISFSTLNEKYDNQVPYDDTALPKVGWYGVGIDYSSLIDDDTADLKDYVHSVFDFDTFLPLPFLARDKAIGLTSEEYGIYTMIVEKEIGDTTYLLCYAKCIDALDTAVKVSELERDDDGRYNTVEHVQDVQPTPKLSSSESNRFAITTVNALCTITTTDMGNMKRAADLLYPDIDEEDRYTLRDLALYSGVELEQSVERMQASFFKYIEVSLDSEDDYTTRMSIGSSTPKVKL